MAGVRAGPVSLVLYDVTSLHFEAEAEAELRQVDPQIQLRPLVDPGGGQP